MPSENGLLHIVILIAPIWTMVMPRFSISTKPSGLRFARSRISCAMRFNSYSERTLSERLTRLLLSGVPFLAYGFARSLRQTQSVSSSKYFSIVIGENSSVCGLRYKTSSPFAFATSDCTRSLVMNFASSDSSATFLISASISPPLASFTWSRLGLSPVYLSSIIPSSASFESS